MNVHYNYNIHHDTTNLTAARNEHLGNAATTPNTSAFPASDRCAISHSINSSNPQPLFVSHFTVLRPLMLLPLLKPYGKSTRPVCHSHPVLLFVNHMWNMGCNCVSIGEEGGAMTAMAVEKGADKVQPPLVPSASRQQ